MEHPRNKANALALFLVACVSISNAQAQTAAVQISPGEVRVCCRPLPKWSGAKDWFEFGLNRLVVDHLHHCYIELAGNVGSSGAAFYGKTSSIHPVAPRNDNKQPMPDQFTDSLTMGGHCKSVEDATPERIKRLQEQLATGACPSCVSNYHNRVLSARYNNCNTYVFELIRAAGMTPPRMSGVPGYHRAWVPIDGAGEKPSITVETDARRERTFRGTNALSEFAGQADAKLLVYFNNENDFALLKRGEKIPFQLKMHLYSPGACCAHRATPALSHDGSHIAFIRLAATQPRREVVSIIDVATRAVKDVFSAGMVWGISWSTNDDRLAVVADTDALGQHELSLIELSSGEAKKLLSRGIEIDGARYSLSDYAPVSWSGDSTRLAVEFRRTGLGTNNGNAGAIVLWDLDTGTFHKLADGVEPSWSPTGDAIAFFDGTRKKCFLVNAEGGVPKLLFSSTTGPLPAGTSPLVFPVAWSPRGASLIFHEWVDADLAVNVYRFDLRSAKIKRVARSELQVVNWR